MPRVLWGSYGGGRFLMSEVPLYAGSIQNLKGLQGAMFDQMVAVVGLTPNTGA